MIEESVPEYADSVVMQDDYAVTKDSLESVFVGHARFGAIARMRMQPNSRKLLWLSAIIHLIFKVICHRFVFKSDTGKCNLPGGQVLIPVEVDYSEPFEGSNHKRWDQEFKDNVHEEVFQRPGRQQDIFGNDTLPYDVMEELDQMDEHERQLYLDELALDSDYYDSGIIKLCRKVKLVCAEDVRLVRE